ncbi:putative mitochondrial F1F0 ATP synthase subunit Atp18 [Biscogniauxia sp. FL1348]|nr:putative mitochondrial F1F0 ATP synthase subunit Atp18 [Biscogniauxia sp. FL1348]
MFWFGMKPLKAWPTPLFKPMAPFYAAGLIVLYGVHRLQTAMMNSDEWKDDPRHPNAKNKGH